MFRRLSWLFLFLLPLAAMAAGEDGDTLSVTWVDGRKFVVLDYYKGYVRKAYYEDEPAARERFRRDSAGLFLDRCYPFGPDTAVDAAVPEDVRVCHFPRIRVKPYWPQPPYWLKAFREALSPASIDTLLRGETDVDLVLNLVYGQDGRIRCLTFRIFGHAWGGVPPEELARLDRAIRENIFYYDKLEGGGRLPERYYLSHFLGVSVKRLFARHENPFFR